MSQQIAIVGSYTLKPGNGDTFQFPLTNTLTTSGSFYNNSTMTVTTSSWQTISQNNNADFRSGLFTNNDLTASIKIAVGNTGSFVILQPQDDNMLTFSGSTTLWAQSIGGKALLSYIVVSQN